jgi:hypothetical protein
MTTLFGAYVGSVRILRVGLLLTMVLSISLGLSRSRTNSGVAANVGESGPIVIATQGYINPTFLRNHTTAPFDSSEGDLIVVCASSHDGITMIPSDSFDNTWISGAGPTNTTKGFDLRTQVWYAKSPKVGPGHTFSLNLSRLEPLVISLFVVKGSDISDPIDAISPIGDDAGSKARYVVSPNIMTSSSNDLLIGFAKSSTAENWISGSEYTAQVKASSNYLDSETQLALTPSSYNSTFALSSSATWQSVVVAVRPSMGRSLLRSEQGSSGR